MNEDDAPSEDMNDLDRQVEDAVEAVRQGSEDINLLDRQVEDAVEAVRQQGGRLRSASNDPTERNLEIQHITGLHEAVRRGRLVFVPSENNTVFHYQLPANT